MQDVFIGRQPIFDKNMDVYAYEHQQWEAVHFADLSNDGIVDIYLNAVKWSNETGISA